MSYLVVGFISTDGTRGTVASAFPEGVWQPRPAPGSPGVDEQDVVLVLHVSQTKDSGAPAAEYACFNACVSALAAAAGPDTSDFADHLAWLGAHGDRMRAVVLTSGAAVDAANVLSARQALAGRGLTVLGYTARELAGRLSRCRAKPDVTSFLQCLQSDPQDIALAMLTMLWTFGLHWDDTHSPDVAACRLAASTSSDPVEQALQRFIASAGRDCPGCGRRDECDWGVKVECVPGKLVDATARLYGPIIGSVQGGRSGPVFERIRTFVCGAEEEWVGLLAGLRDEWLEGASRTDAQ